MGTIGVWVVAYPCRQDFPSWMKPRMLPGPRHRGLTTMRRYLLTPLTGNKEGSKSLLVLRVKSTPTCSRPKAFITRWPTHTCILYWVCTTRMLCLLCSVIYFNFVFIRMFGQVKIAIPVPVKVRRETVFSPGSVKGPTDKLAPTTTLHCQSWVLKLSRQPWQAGNLGFFLQNFRLPYRYSLSARVIVRRSFQGRGLVTWQ